MATKIKQSPTKTYGEMLKMRQFKELVSELSDLKTHAPEAFKKYTQEKDNGDFSDFTMLFYYLPQYSAKLIELDITQRTKEELKEVQEDGMTKYKDENGNHYTLDINGSIDEVVQNNPVKKPSKTDIEDGVKELFDFLLENGAEVDIYFKKEHGKNALFKACEDSVPEYINMLEKSGKIDLFIQDGAGRDALFYASAQERLDIMDFLVKEKGFDVNREMIMEDNKTLLHMICYNAMDDELFPVIDKLLELGASLKAEDFSGMKPHEYLKEMLEDEEHRFEEVPEIIQQAKEYIELLSQKLTEVEENDQNKKPKYQTSF